MDSGTQLTGTHTYRNTHTLIGPHTLTGKWYKSLNVDNFLIKKKVDDDKVC